MKTIFTLFFAIFILAGCQPAVTLKPSKVKTETYEIVYINKPKHFSVNLKHLETGHIFENVGRRKHCSRWRNSPIGTKISVNTFYYENGTFSVDSNHVKHIICG